MKKIKFIDDFDFSRTKKRVLKDFDQAITDSYLEKGIFNLKLYYVVALLDPLNEHAVSRFVDPFWHAHILHTEEYIDFCNEVFNQYIQHKPLDEEDEKENAQVNILYEHTLTVYKKLFKQIDSQWWPEFRSEVSGVPGPTVCRHMCIYDSAIRSEALFPTMNLCCV